MAYNKKKDSWQQQAMSLAKQRLLLWLVINSGHCIAWGLWILVFHREDNNNTGNNHIKTRFSEFLLNVIFSLRLCFF